jgi:hypothetical protein
MFDSRIFAATDSPPPHPTLQARTWLTSHPGTSTPLLEVVVIVSLATVVVLVVLVVLLVLLVVLTVAFRQK